ncbi:hypothetical protein QR680_012303 [Steinernema hermaphroditum]|uniref:Uncharacterized protein n=1 Tax=Steinernema hermaphroditum TaxID=289476 RepID=A0AA39I1L6_9BILA|nr:hypothetical protein QR680_012303 [Steinernema hermaphroditum]
MIVKFCKDMEIRSADVEPSDAERKLLYIVNDATYKQAVTCGPSSNSEALHHGRPRLPSPHNKETVRWRRHTSRRREIETDRRKFLLLFQEFTQKWAIENKIDHCKTGFLADLTAIIESDEFISVSTTLSEEEMNAFGECEILEKHEVCPARFVDELGSDLVVDHALRLTSLVRYTISNLLQVALERFFKKFISCRILKKTMVINVCQAFSSSDVAFSVIGPEIISLTAKVIKEGAKLRTRLIAAKRDRDYLTKRRERGFAEARDSVDKDVKSPNGYSIIKCLLCDGNHFTNSCYVYESYAQRTERCIQMDLCPTCMFRKHDGVCRLSHDCRTCRKGSHAAAMCSWHVELDNEIRELEKELSRLEDGERWRDVERR